MHWYKHSPDRWRAGTIGMSYEQKGMHADLISNYIDRDGNLPDDDELLVRILGCRLRLWRRLKSELLKIEKLHIVDGKLIPNGVETTMKQALNSQKTQTTLAKNVGKSTKTADRVKSLESRKEQAASRSGFEGKASKVVPMRSNGAHPALGDGYVPGELSDYYARFK